LRGTLLVLPEEHTNKCIWDKPGLGLLSTTETDNTSTDYLQIWILALPSTEIVKLTSGSENINRHLRNSGKIDTKAG
jgi:hypothetical protein